MKISREGSGQGGCEPSFCENTKKNRRGAGGGGAKSEGAGGGW